MQRSKTPLYQFKLRKNWNIFITPYNALLKMFSIKNTLQITTAQRKFMACFQDSFIILRASWVIELTH